jgi:hypothetical protein
MQHEWKPKYEVQPTVQSMIARGSGCACGDMNTQRNAPGPTRVEAVREREDPPPPPYVREPEDSANVSTIGVVKAPA